MINHKPGIMAGLLFLMTALMGFPAVGRAASDTQTLPLTFYIQPVTAVRAEGHSGSASVELGPILPGIEQSESLTVKILTNSEQRFKIFHRYLSSVTSSRGAQVPEGSMRFLVSAGKAGGQSAVPGWTEVPEGRTLVFSSGASGGEETFNIDYLVSAKKPLEAGDYFGQIRLEVEQE